MPKKVNITCAECGNSHQILEAEYNRQIKNGREHFFCSLNCTAVYNNRSVKSEQIQKICPHCHSKFTTWNNCKAATYCSRSCASAASVTEYRQQKAKEIGKQNQDNLLTDLPDIANALRSREWSKYELLAEVLSAMGIDYIFEAVMPGGHIVDLVLPEKNLVVEFDGPDHKLSSQKENDQKRDQDLYEQGWCVKRIAVQSGERLEDNPEINNLVY